MATIKLRGADELGFIVINKIVKVRKRTGDESQVWIYLVGGEIIEEIHKDDSVVEKRMTELKDALGNYIELWSEDGEESPGFLSPAHIVSIRGLIEKRTRHDEISIYQVLVRLPNEEVIEEEHSDARSVKRRIEEFKRVVEKYATAVPNLTFEDE